MTSTEKTIVQSLVAIAWADGKFKEPEEGMIDSLLWAFGASDEEEAELREYASKKRTLEDVPADELSDEDKGVVLAHAALLTHADGKQTPAELKLLAALVKRIGMTEEQAQPIIDGARDKAAKLAERLG